MNVLESRPPAETVVRKLANANSIDVVFASGRSLRLSRFLASCVDPEDEVQFSLPLESSGFNSPELLTKSSSGHCLYQTMIGYAAEASSRYEVLCWSVQSSSTAARHTSGAGSSRREMTRGTKGTSSSS